MELQEVGIQCGYEKQSPGAIPVKYVRVRDIISSHRVDIAEKKILPHPDYKNGKALSRNNSFSQMNTPPSSQSEAPTLEECESRVREVKRQGNEAPKEYTHKPCNNDNGSPYNSQSKVKGEPESDEDSCDEKAALRASNGKVGTKAYSSKKACVPQTEIYVLELEGGRYYVGKSTDVVCIERLKLKVFLD